MATVRSLRAPVNRTPVDGLSSFPALFPASQPISRPAKSAQARLDRAALATLWHALAKSAAKEAIRDDLAAGAAQVVNATISGDIDGLAFEPLSLSAVLTVGHDSQRASTVTPEVPHLVAAILAKLNTATRDAILRDLPNEFAAAGCELPEAPAELIDRTNGMLVQLRAKQSSPVRGAVSCKYSMGRRPAAVAS